jgi:5-methylcytosine-specific restriction endonuclease McrA
LSHTTAYVASLGGAADACPDVVREQVLERDRHTCQFCGARRVRMRVEDGYELDRRLLVAICVRCSDRRREVARG